MTWAHDLARKRQAADNPPPLFGIILYTDSNPNLKKVLRDDDYWTALDEISGPKWAIFSVRAYSGQWEEPNIGFGEMGKMVPTWKEPAANQELLHAFEITDTSILPVLAVFILQGDHLDQTIIRIDDTDPYAAYSSIKTVITKVASALENIDKELIQDPDIVFKKVAKVFRGIKFWRTLTSGHKILKEVRPYLP